MPEKVDLSLKNGRLIRVRINDVPAQLEIISETLSSKQPSDSSQALLGRAVSFDLLVCIKTPAASYYIPFRKTVTRLSTDIYPLGKKLYNNIFDAAMAFNPIDFDNIKLKN